MSDIKFANCIGCCNCFGTHRDYVYECECGSKTIVAHNDVGWKRGFRCFACDQSYMWLHFKDRPETAKTITVEELALGVKYEKPGNLDILNLDSVLNLEKTVEERKQLVEDLKEAFRKYQEND